MADGSSGDMAIETVIGLAVLSGKGGVGKSVISLNLALALGHSGVKTLLFDAGGGDLANLANAGQFITNKTRPDIFQITDNVGLYTSSITDSYTVFDEENVEEFLAEIVRVTPGYSYAVFDCPTGAEPISYILGGLSEKIIVVSTPDPTSIAGAYLLIKTLHQDGLSKRCGLLFNCVKSADEAASLKTRFDIITRRFLKQQFEQIGYIRDESILAESVLEQQPLLLENRESDSSLDFISLAESLRHQQRFHFETGVLKTHSGHGA
jgi:flagellar biosynthesis protein FlhG